ncbi:hypothetical protein TYRP_017234 [Tyrophagus putrescentiae]|nr:hypothetical protein TYRP_017234 [Tyrophagus putrescentiae]
MAVMAVARRAVLQVLKKCCCSAQLAWRADLVVSCCSLKDWTSSRTFVVESSFPAKHFHHHYPFHHHHHHLVQFIVCSSFLALMCSGASGVGNMVVVSVSVGGLMRS